MVNNIILTGIPRSGTTLSCRLLNQVENVLALVEPLDMTQFKACTLKASRLDFVENYFESVRRAINENNFIDLPNFDEASTNTFAVSTSGMRDTLIKGRCLQKINRAFTSSFSLIIKHPNAFTALLNELKEQWRCYALIRNPLAVIASWSSLNHPLCDGHAPMAEHYDSDLQRMLASIVCKEQRQLILLNWYFEKFLTELDLENIFQYEKIVQTNGNCLSQQILGVDVNAGNLTSKNANPIYNLDDMRRFADLLIKDAGAWRSFYSETDIGTLLVVMSDR